MSQSDDDALLRAVADNHRDWMARWAAAEGADAVVVGAATVYLADEAGVFPEVAPDPDALVDAIRARDCRSVGYWSLTADDELGARLLARGFGWGWRPHWMAIELDDPAAFAPSPELPFTVAPAAPPYARTLPYAPSPQVPDPPGTLRLGVRLREKVIGQIVVNPRDGVAGIYSMGVAPRVRGRGIATALTREACRRAMIEHGCRYAVLNATDDGERVYRHVGFRSLGWGQTWWYSRGPAPTARQVALAEAAGLGDVASLRALAPTDGELDGPLPGAESLLMLAVVTGRAAVVEYLLARRPSLAARRFAPHRTTLLHLAVEHDSAPLVELALAHGVDPGVRDASFGGTALGWAEHFGRRDLVRRLAEVTPAG
ncbi:MAG TPA: GNAT family N-acetyltransferase [Solirubrobacteraceae bacterium]|nr:GNAT family N-acetyltransferase [Solirubrobacteraceae bacterium]